MSAVIRKKLNLALRSEKIDGERVYQIWRSAGQSAGKPPGARRCDLAPQDNCCNRIGAPPK